MEGALIDLDVAGDPGPSKHVVAVLVVEDDAERVTCAVIANGKERPWESSFVPRDEVVVNKAIERPQNSPLAVIVVSAVSG